MVLGVLSGYFGNRTDAVIMFLLNSFNSIPDFLLILVVISILGTSTKVLIIAISIIGIPHIIRIVRGKVLEVKNKDYYLWAKSIGCSDFRIITIHLWSDLLPVILVSVALRFSWAILIESAIGYLGFISPSTPSIGNMLLDAQNYIFSNPFYILIPGSVITVIAFSVNLIAKGIEEGEGLFC